MNVSDARKAHKILDDLFKRKPVLDEEREFLRSALPELPKQKTLEEIVHDVYEAWIASSGDEWIRDGVVGSVISLEDWLKELHEQLKGLKDTSAVFPALPSGMRIADHEVYGRVVTSPKPNRDGVYDLLVSRPKFETGADWEYAHECELTFIDAEPAAPAHPVFLETEADYRDAPEGTIVAKDSSGAVCVKTCLWPDMMVPTVKRRVLRWGWGDK